MIPGDADRAAFENHITNYHGDRLKAFALSASHHGSRTFFVKNEGDEPYKAGLEAIDPDYIVISAPLREESDHGHPHEDAEKLNVEYAGKENVVHTGADRFSYIFDVYRDVIKSTARFSTITGILRHITALKVATMTAMTRVNPRALLLRLNHRPETLRRAGTAKCKARVRFRLLSRLPTNCLVQANLVEIADNLTATPDGGGKCEFQCFAPVPENTEGLPPRALLKVVIPSTFPFQPLEVFSCEETIRGFPHQDAESHKLCLNPDSEVPYDEKKLVRYIEWSIGWLKDAATGSLVKIGDPYELPDFSRKKLGKPLSIQFPLYFVETAASFSRWSTRLGQVGQVVVAWPKNPHCLLAWKFSTESGDLIWECPFSKNTKRPAPMSLSVRGFCYLTSGKIALDQPRPLGSYLNCAKLPELISTRH